METFKVNHDSQCDYAKWAKQVYGDNKCVVSAVEKGNGGNNHVHFIGYVTLSEKEFEYEYGEIKADHPWHDQKNADGTARYTSGQLAHVMRKSNKEVTELGFQYVMKTNAKPEYSQGFEEGELDALKAASDAHVEKLKNGPKEYIHAKKYAGTPKEIFLLIRCDIIEYMRENKQPIWPQFKRQCLTIMMTHPQYCAEWRQFIADAA